MRRRRDAAARDPYPGSASCPTPPPGSPVPRPRPAGPWALPAAGRGGGGGGGSGRAGGGGGDPPAGLGAGGLVAATAPRVGPRGGPIEVTASIGVGFACPADADLGAVIGRADQALYAAKGQGR